MELKLSSIDLNCELTSSEIFCLVFFPLLGAVKYPATKPAVIPNETVAIVLKAFV